MRNGVIEIEGMEFYAFHGCYEEEQIVGNRFLVDLMFETDVENASSSDSIEDTVSYLEVYQITAAEMAVKSHLLENVAKRIIDAIIDKFPAIKYLKVRVSKCNPPLGGFINKVSVTMDKKN